MPNVAIRDYSVGRGNRPLLIAGPCVIENEQMTLEIAHRLIQIAIKYHVPLVFKASFDKANRTRKDSFRGVGLDEGLAVLELVSNAIGAAVTTDVHLPDQATAVAQVCELVQVPAFLARQTDLLEAVAATGRAVNVKKGQFMAPQDMQYVLEKLVHPDSPGAMLCERGTFFGYGRLVNDMQSIPIMQSFGAPVIFDATHSVQYPSGSGGVTGGNRAMVEPLARAAAAVGVDGFFFEVHPDPDRSPSDGPNMVPLDQFEAMFGRVLRVWETAREIDA